MEFRHYLGDERLRHKIEYSSNGASDCIYCGCPANSREHVPSKIFLDKPYPPNLYLVPACKKCNYSFSADELYTWFAVKYLEKQFFNVQLSNLGESRYQKQTNILNTVIDDLDTYTNSCDFQTSIYHFQSTRMERILEKLARGHMVFELSEGYNTLFSSEWITKRVLYAFRPILSPETINDYDCAVDIQDFLLPEIGSRVYEHIHPISIPIATYDNSHCLKLGAIFLDWTDVQDDKYRYIAIFGNDTIQVNIVIDEFLFASVFFGHQTDKNAPSVFCTELFSEEACRSLQGVACSLVNWGINLKK